MVHKDPNPETNSSCVDGMEVERRQKPEYFPAGLPSAKVDSRNKAQSNINSVSKSICNQIQENYRFSRTLDIGDEIQSVNIFKCLKSAAPVQRNLVASLSAGTWI